MAKKRSCRRTENENILHDRAVKLRKMTDEQLITFIDNQVESARNDKKNKRNRGDKVGADKSSVGDRGKCK